MLKYYLYAVEGKDVVLVEENYIVDWFINIPGFKPRIIKPHITPTYLR